MRKGLTRAETDIKQLEELGWAYEFRQDSDARVTELICIPDISRKFLVCFLEALIIDCTYKTNRYKLPLLDIVGQTNTNSTFYIGFGLLAAEDEVHYLVPFRHQVHRVLQMLGSFSMVSIIRMRLLWMYAQMRWLRSFLIWSGLQFSDGRRIAPHHEDRSINR